MHVKTERNCLTLTTVLGSTPPQSVPFCSILRSTAHLEQTKERGMCIHTADKGEVQTDFDSFVFHSRCSIDSRVLPSMHVRMNLY